MTGKGLEAGLVSGEPVRASARIGSTFAGNDLTPCLYPYTKRASLP